MRLVFVLLFALPLFPQGQSDTALSGSVTDSSGRPVPRAALSLFARDQTEPLHTLTNEAGAFRFDHLIPGEYLLQVQAPGFARYTSQSVHLARGATPELDVSLSIASLQQQIVVTASATPQSADELAKSATVIDHESVDQRDEFFIPEVLRIAPGLRVQQLGGPGSFTTIKIRGLRTEDTAVLIDGLRFRDPTSTQGDASGYLEDMIVTNIDRIEVLRGSASALYGTNAIGGVINIITDQGGGRTHGNLLLEGGGLGLFRGRSQIAGGAFGDRLQYSAGLAHLNVTGGVNGDHPARTTSGQGYLLYRLSSSAQLSARLYGADSFLRLDSEPQAIGLLPATGIIPAVPGATFLPAPVDPSASRAGRFISGAVTLSGRSASGLGYNLSYQGLNTNALFPRFQPAGHTDRENDGTTHTATARLNAQLGIHQLVDTGYEFEDEHYLNRNFPINPAQNSVVEVSEQSHAFFVNDQWRLLGDRLQIAGVFRAQWFSLSHPRFTPVETAPYQGITFAAPPAGYTGDASMAYFIRDTGTKLRTHAGRGYRAPSLYERFGTFYGSFGYGVYGDPRLSPNRSIGGDVGIDQTFGGGRARASATYFYTRLQQVIGFGSIRGRDPFGRLIGYMNQGGGLARGVEAGLSAAATRSLDLMAAYTFTNSRQRTPIVEGVTRSLIIPDHQFSVTATQHLGRRLFVNFDFTASSNYLALLFDSNFVGHAFRFPGMRKADIGASYHIPLGENASLRIFGKVENALNQHYFESGFGTPGAFATGGLQFGF